MFPTNGIKGTQDNEKYNCPTQTKMPKRSVVSNSRKEMPEKEGRTVGLVPAICSNWNGATFLEENGQQRQSVRPKCVIGKKTSPGKMKSRKKEDIREILERIRRKKEGKSTEVKTQLNPTSNAEEISRLSKKKENSVMALISKFEGKQEQKEDITFKVSNLSKVSGVKKIGRKKSIYSCTSPSIKRGLEKLTKQNQPTLVEIWGKESCSVGSPKLKKLPKSKFGLDGAKKS